MMHRSCVCLLAVVPLLVAAQAPAQEEGASALAPPPQTHWTTTEKIGRGAGPVDAAKLAAAPSDTSSWLHFSGNYQGWRHSPIATLTPESVPRLRLSWMFQTGISGQLEASPIVYDGVLYLTSAMNRLFAIDAVTGALRWRYDHQNPGDLRICCGPANRGPAIAGDLILMATLDARLVALNRLTGEIVWNVAIGDYTKGTSATSAPLVVKDLAIIGVGGGEFGVRGYFDAYEVATGKRRFRHYTVPAAGEPGAETWAGESYKTGGAPPWTIGAYDEVTDTLFWTSGNPGPDWNGDERAGDNLYSDSVLAVDPSTGKRKWHFQFTPHDVWDYDGNSELYLVDIERNGERVPAIAQANRNGYFYLLDRRDGRFLGATQYVDQLNWGTIDARGRPVVNPKALPQEEPTERVCPGLAGGHQGSYAGAYSPATGLAYVPVIESCMQFRKDLAIHIEGVPFFGGEPVPIDGVEGKSYGHLSAIDVATGKVAWKYRDPHPMMAGVLSTAGGVVITGNASGFILAFDAKTGREVWRFSTGSGLRSHPIAYQLDGRTFVAVGSGGGGIVQEIAGSPSILPQGSALLVFELPPGG